MSTFSRRSALMFVCSSLLHIICYCFIFCSKSWYGCAEINSIILMRVSCEIKIVCVCEVLKHAKHVSYNTTGQCGYPMNICVPKTTFMTYGLSLFQAIRVILSSENRQSRRAIFKKINNYREWTALGQQTLFEENINVITTPGYMRDIQ